MPTNDAHRSDTMEPWRYEYNALAQRQDETEAALDYIHHMTTPPVSAPVLDGCHHPPGAADTDGSVYSYTQRHQQHHHATLRQARSELSMVWQHNVRLAQTAMQNSILVASGYPIGGSSPAVYARGPPQNYGTIQRVRENYARVLATLRSTLQTERQGLLQEERALTTAVDHAYSALMHRSETRRAASKPSAAPDPTSSAQASRDSNFVVMSEAPRMQRSVVTLSQLPGHSRHAMLAPAVHSPSSRAPTAMNVSTHAAHYRLLADQANRGYYDFLQLHGGLTFGWPEYLHDRFLRVALQVQRAATPGAAKPPTVTGNLLPASELRDAAVEVLGQSVDPTEIEHHVELYLRYLSLVQCRKQAIATYQLEKETIAMQEQQLTAWRELAEAQWAAAAQDKTERGRQKRQAELKESVAIWRAKRDAAAHEAAAQIEVDRLAARRRAKAAGAALSARRMVGPQSSPRLATDSEATAPAASEEAKALAALKRKTEAAALRSRREQDLAQARERHTMLTNRHRSEAQSTKAAIGDRTLRKLKRCGKGAVLRPNAVTETRYWDPTTSSVQHGRSGLRDGTTSSRVEWFVPPVREVWAATAHMQTALYKRQTAAPSWCGGNYQL